MKNKRIDSTTTLLILFMALLLSLFIYLFYIEKNIENYTLNHDHLIKLELLDKEFNNFAISMNSFRNYDEINKLEDQFQQTLSELNKNLTQNYSKDHKLAIKLLKIQTNFQEKRDNIEYFKSLNASLISGSHFLFDLQTTIAEQQEISLKTKNLVNEALFFILRFASSDYIDKAFVIKKLNKIKTDKLKQIQAAHLINNFYQQATVMLHNIAAIKESAFKIKNSDLYNSIEDLNRALNTLYAQNLFTQKIIAVLFFISTLIILITLIITNLKARKNEKELYAFKYAVEHSDNSILLTDPDRNITFVNDVFEKSTGYTKEEVLGKSPRLLKSYQHDDNFYQELNEKLAREERWDGEFINKRKDGSFFYEKASIVPVVLNNKLISFLSIKLDITEYIEQNKKLAQAASVFENTEEAIIIANAQGEIISVNGAFSTIYGYKHQEVLGKTLQILHSEKQNENFYHSLWEQLNKNGIWRGKLINKTKNGELISVWSTIKKVTDKNGNTINFTAIQTDLRAIENTQAKADYLAYHDSLTGLYNRNNFEEYLAHALFIARKNNTMLAVLFIDLDRFKVINDTLGHDIGDKVLITVAKRLKHALRENDFISRWGGDEFVVIMENFDATEEVAYVASNIIKHLKQPMKIDAHQLVTTASIGISLYPQNGENANTLIKHADSAMYLAKDMGKNNFRFYTTELSKKIQNKLDIDMALHNALQNKEFYMVFQPQYSLKTKKIFALEALVRWKNPQLGTVAPDQFIPIAEDSGVIIPLGYFIIEESCKEYKKMKDQGVDIQHIAINVSSIQFKKPDLLDHFLQITKKYNLSPSEIEIEITERFIMEHTLANMTMLQNFQKEGFMIAIDDFGTGYSSMSYLKQLPIDTIKIDKSFVDDIAEGSSDNVIIDAIIALSKTLGYTIIAEGIETKAQEDFLTNLSCDIGQGYIFSKPLSSKEIIKRFS